MLKQSPDLERLVVDVGRKEICEIMTVLQCTSQKSGMLPPTTGILRGGILSHDLRADTLCGLRLHCASAHNRLGCSLAFSEVY